MPQKLNKTAISYILRKNSKDKRLAVHRLLNWSDPRGGVDKDYFIRSEYFKHNLEDERARIDKDSRIKIAYYKNHLEDDRARVDNDLKVRTEYYKDHPNDERALQTKDTYIITQYYINHKDDPDIDAYFKELDYVMYYKAFPNDFRLGEAFGNYAPGSYGESVTADVRYRYFLAHPKDIRAKKDPAWVVRLQYYVTYSKDKDAKHDEDHRVQDLYYDNFPEDEDAIEMDRFCYDYFYRHPKDKRAKKSKNSLCRKIYYENHLEDEDVLKELDEYFFFLREGFFARKNWGDKRAALDPSIDIREEYDFHQEISNKIFK